MELLEELEETPLPRSEESETEAVSRPPSSPLPLSDIELSVCEPLTANQLTISRQLLM